MYFNLTSSFCQKCTKDKKKQKGTKNNMYDYVTRIGAILEILSKPMHLVLTFSCYLNIILNINVYLNEL